MKGRKKRRIVAVVFSITIVIFLAFISLNGMKMYEAESFCSNETYRCQGIYTGECIGTVDKETDYYSRGQCPVSNITAECNRIGEKICGVNNNSIGTAWADSASVEGRTCSEWDQQYSINLTSC